jgi:hypothetical protein
MEVENILNNNILIKDSINLNKDAIFNYEVEKLIQKWKNNPSMMDYLKKKAIKKDQPLEQVIIDDAQWYIRKHGSQ